MICIYTLYSWFEKTQIWLVKQNNDTDQEISIDKTEHSRDCTSLSYMDEDDLVDQ